VLSAKLGQNNQQNKNKATYRKLNDNLPAFAKKSKPLVGK
jgi:hypothetical protein